MNWDLRAEKSLSKILFKKITIIFCLAVCIGAHAQFDEGIQAIPHGLNVAEEASSVPPNRSARLTYYRPFSGVPDGVVHSEINGRYHTSLEFGRYVEVCLPSAEVILMAQALGSLQQAQSTQLNIHLERDSYVRVTVNPDKTVELVPVSEGIALSELRQSSSQSHVISRVNSLQTCHTPKTAIGLPTKHSADVHFNFGKSDVDAISSEGLVALNELLMAFKAQESKAQKSQIVIVGYSDPLGSSAAKHTISAARAHSVLIHLIRRGVPLDMLRVEWRSDSSLITSHCQKEITPKSIACNKTNRRVELFLLTANQVPNS